MSAPDDEALIRKAKRGDREAFGLLVERHYRAAYASAYGVLGNVSDAEEMAQETFVQVFQKLENLREPRAFTSWVWRIARDTSLKHIRKHRRIKHVGDSPDLSPEIRSPAEPLMADEEKEQLIEALNELPEEMREAVLMRYWEELEYEDMEARTGASAAALYQRVCRGLKKLREIMERREKDALA